MTNNCKIITFLEVYPCHPGSCRAFAHCAANPGPAWCLLALLVWLCGELVGSGYGPSHTWEGYRGHGGGRSTASVGGDLRLQAERLQSVLGRMHLSFLYGRTQLSRREGVSAERNQQRFYCERKLVNLANPAVHTLHYINKEKRFQHP